MVWEKEMIELDIDGDENKDRETVLERELDRSDKITSQKRDNT